MRVLAMVEHYPPLDSRWRHSPAPSIERSCLDRDDVAAGEAGGGWRADNRDLRMPFGPYGGITTRNGRTAGCQKARQAPPHGGACRYTRLRKLNKYMLRGSRRCCGASRICLMAW